jgi:hypothetical protein
MTADVEDVEMLADADSGKGYKDKGGKGRGKGQWGRGYNREQPPEVLTHKKHHCTECDHAGDVPKSVVQSHDRQFCTRPGQPFHGRPVAGARQAQPAAADKEYLAGMAKVQPCVVRAVERQGGCGPSPGATAAPGALLTCASTSSNYTRA